jgi:hypothetical protein
MKTVTLAIKIPDLKALDGTPTCATNIAEKSCRCQFFGSRRFGTVDCCTLFQEDLERRQVSTGEYTGMTIPCASCQLYRRKS